MAAETWWQLAVGWKTPFLENFSEEQWNAQWYEEIAPFLCDLNYQGEW